MAHTLLRRIGFQKPTLTVGQLIERLQAFDSNVPVVFGVPDLDFASMADVDFLTVDSVSLLEFEREEVRHPSCVRFNEQDELVVCTDHTNVFPAWSGVVIR